MGQASLHRHSRRVEALNDTPFAGTLLCYSGGIPPGSCLLAYQPKKATSLAASLVNLANPGTHDLTAPYTWDAVNGWRLTAASASTGLVPPGTQAQSMYGIFSNWPANTDSVIAGIYDSSTKSLGLRPNYIPGGGHTYRNGGAVNSVAGYLTAGRFCVAGAKGYWNGSLETSAIPGWSGAPGSAISVNMNAVAGGYIQLLYYYNIDISSYVAALDAVLATW